MNIDIPRSSKLSTTGNTKGYYFRINIIFNKEKRYYQLSRPYAEEEKQHAHVRRK